MPPIPTELLELIEDLRDLAFEEVERHRQAMGVYRGDRQASMDATIAKADALLTTPPADAADMGGQAGEEVGLNGLIVERDIMGAMHIKLPAYDGGAPIDLVQIQYRYPYTDNASTKRLAEKIAGLISGKLEAVSSEELAQHRQQAGKLMEALRKIHFRADCFVEDDRDMPVTSIEAIVRIAGEALAAWDVKP